MHGNMNVKLPIKSVHKRFDNITDTTAQEHKIEHTLAKCGYLLPFLAGLCLTSSTCLIWKCAGKKVYYLRTVTSRRHIFTTHIQCIIPEQSARYMLSLFIH